MVCVWCVEPATHCPPPQTLNTGPHVPNTGFVKFLEVMDVSSSYWQGKAENDSLQRVYGVSFRSKEDLEMHKQYLAEAEKRDHR